MTEDDVKHGLAHRGITILGETPKEKKSKKKATPALKETVGEGTTE